jgi:hypothetical protein
MKRIFLTGLIIIISIPAFAQVDVEHRRTLTIQTGFPIGAGQEEIGGVGFYWFNENHYPWTNTALRVIFAGVYADGELSYFLPSSTNTAFGAGLGGGVFVDNITPYVQGNRLNSQKFYGDNGNGRVFINQTIPNPTPLPLNVRATYIISGSLYRRTSQTSAFTIPHDFMTQTLQAELRFGGIEPGLTARRGLELYVAADANYRTGFDAFGPNGALFPRNSSYQRVFASLAGKIPVDQTTVFVRIGGGLGEHIDELSAWKLGGNLTGMDSYTYTLHGYYTREIFAEDFGIANLELRQRLTEKYNLTAHLYGDYAIANTTAPLDGRWHNFFGAGAGLSFRTFWDINMLVSYGYGFNAVRYGRRGGNEIGLALEKQF